MKKVIKVAVAVTGLGVVFVAGSFTGASTDWETNAINNAYSELLDTAAGTTTELTTNADEDIDMKIKTEIQSTVDSQQAELEALLEQYYQMKLNGLTQTPEFLALEQQIKDIQKSVLESYKKQIDEAFNTTP